jgi:hypothetical protein
MRKATARDDDRTTTGGRVMGSSTGYADHGKKLALDGDVATCGNCKGIHRIFGTGKGISDKGRNVVVDGDSVLCPCGKNRVIVGSNPGYFLTSNHGSAGASSVGNSSALVTSDSGHWIKFVLRESVSCEGLRCAAHFTDGSVEYGVFDSDNTVRFDRIEGNACSRVELLLGGSDRRCFGGPGCVLCLWTGSAVLCYRRSHHRVDGRSNDYWRCLRRLYG